MKISFHNISARHFRIFHQVIQLPKAAVDIHVDETPIRPRQSNLPRHPMRRLFASQKSIREWIVTRSVNFVEVICPQNQVVTRHRHGVMTIIFRRRPPLMIRTTRVVRCKIVDRPEITVHKCSLNSFVAENRPPHPCSDGWCGEPLMIRTKKTRALRFTETN